MDYKFSLKDEKYKDFLLNIKEHFSKCDTSIHKARNEIKLVNFENEILAVKSFKIPTFPQNFIYSFLRESKAKRSYLHALRLGEICPKAIGFIEFYQNSLLLESFFISENFHYDFSIREVLNDKNFHNREQIFAEFAAFSFNLHEKNILHKDYSAGNILIKKQGEKYIFKIVDLNRLKFTPLSLRQRLKNFAMLWADDEDLDLIAKYYSILSKYDENLCQILIKHYSNQNKKIKNFKKILKGKSC